MSGYEEELARARRRIAELEATRRSLSVFRQLFEQSIDLMCVAGLDGHFEELNAAWKAVLGFEIQELKRRPFLDLVHPDDRARTRGAVDRLVAGERVVAFENRCGHADGGYRTLAWNAAFDAERRVLVGVARDVTEHHETREALRSREEAYHQLFDGMLDGFSFHDMIFDERGQPIDYRFRAVNPAFEQMTGLSAEKLVGRRVLEVLPGTEQHWIETFGAVAKTGEPIRYENYSQEFDKWFEVLAFRPAEGQFACTFHDITARKKAEAERAALQAQVEHAQKLESLGLMAGGIAHDFNNLLTAIAGGVDLVLCELPPEAEQPREELAEVLGATQRAAELCRQLLTYAGRAEVTKQSVDLTELVSEMLGLATRALSKKLTIHRELSEAPLPILADPSQLRQLVLNLVLNAGDAIGDDPGVITVATGVRRFELEELDRMIHAGTLDPGDYAYVAVEDDGCGMSPETIQKIFDPFFTTKHAGRGLGLAATLGILQAHGGAVMVESRPGVGTRFLVALPMHAAEAADADAKAPEPELEGEGRILLCDDEEMVRRVATRMVNSLGFDVTEAKNGREALEFFENRPDGFRAVLLDITMPEMGGLEVVPRLRAIRPEVPIVLMSGYSEDRMTSHRVADEHLVFVSKPFKRDAIAAALSRALTSAE